MNVLIWVLSITILVCCITISILIMVIFNKDEFISKLRHYLDDIAIEHTKNFKEVMQYQNICIDLKDSYYTLQGNYEELKNEHEDLHLRYDIACTEYEFCRKERDEYKHRLEDYEHFVI